MLKYIELTNGWGCSYTMLCNYTPSQAQAISPKVVGVTKASHMPHYFTMQPTSSWNTHLTKLINKADAYMHTLMITIKALPTIYD